jgi:hypothetical protein
VALEPHGWFATMNAPLGAEGGGGGDVGVFS